MGEVIELRPLEGDPLVRTSWAGLLSPYQRPIAEASVVAAFEVADSGCKPFRALADNGKRYWVKHLDNDHGIQSLMVERVVASVGQMLGAPVRPIALVQIPEVIARDPILAGHGVRAGIGHGSEHLEGAIEKEFLDNTMDDGNRYRQPRFLAIWDLFAGADSQWLYSTTNDFELWSFDHGFWVSGGELGDWNGTDLEKFVKMRPGPPESPKLTKQLRQMDRQSFLDVADALDTLSVRDLLSAVATVPLDWGIPDEDLESFAWWLYYRKSISAGQMRGLSKIAAN